MTLLLTTSCVVGPDYETPEPVAPVEYTSELERGLTSGSAQLDEWWTQFEDPLLDSLIQRALERNLDIDEALTRIREARAFRSIAGTRLFPTIDANGSYTRTRTSADTANGAFSERTFNNFALGFDATWEIDVWGRSRRNLEANRADFDAVLEDARDVLISVLAETALNYVDLRNFQERARIARANILRQEQTLELTQNLYEANLVSLLDVVQAKTNLESTRATLPTLEAEARAARNRLAVLLGLYPGDLEEELRVVTPIPVAPVEIAVGVPADIIRRRPDIRRAERELAAQTARIGIEVAELYPRLTLFGNIGFETEHVNKFFRRDALAAGFGPSLTWNVFNRDRIRDNIRIEDARQEAALVRYERSILLALEEVENAMTRFVRDQISADSLNLAVREAKRAVELSRNQYSQGLVSFQSVLDSQSRLFSLEELLAERRASITSNSIALYKALGGGWETRDIILSEAYEESD